MTAQTIDEYLTGVPEAKRGALERLRAQIRDAAPDATETISYDRPAFRLDGRYFVGFGVTRSGCSFSAGRAPVDAHAAELSAFRAWKGTHA
jgi:uncharacterized protein YdhG (YjbR/CyaY superfamily)